MRASWLLALGALTLGCAANQAVETNAALGKIVIYRNGVAYFERYAEADERSLDLRVPTARVDDFLKSLTITDQDSGKALPVSYPTIESDGGYVTMHIPLPARHGRLRVTYVTESPAWKPSYRLVLGKGDKARLQGWAVVDNTSGEDWEAVKIGVGSTSALSFRYDLRSVRLVERQALSGGAPVAAAPPVGGTPYSIATRDVRVVDQVAQSELQLGGVTVRGGGGDGAGRDSVQNTPSGSHWSESGRFASLAERLKNSGARVRIEGYADANASDKQRSSGDNAERVRRQLEAHGVPGEQLEVVPTGQVSAIGVRIVEREGQGPQTADEGVAARDTQPLGHAHFVSRQPLRIESDHSAMVSILHEATRAERVYYYDPVSSRGSTRFAFSAVRFENPSRYTLDAGPFTVYAGGQFLGEGLSEPILPGAVAFVPYALDRSIVVDPTSDSREEIERLITIQRGVANTEMRRIKRTKLTLANRGSRDAEVYMRHQVAKDYRLRSVQGARHAPFEKLGGANLLVTRVPAGKAVEVVVEEDTPLFKTVDIRTDRGVKAMGLFLAKDRIDAELRQRLDALVKRHSKKADLEERIATLEDQMSVYGERLAELNVQLATLRRVDQAAKLRKHLSDKMEEISDIQQRATLNLSELKGELMTLRIEIQDQLADLTLERKSDKSSAKKLADNAPSSPR
jgi:uncharacterized coiled-coil protein SlyX